MGNDYMCAGSGEMLNRLGEVVNIAEKIATIEEETASVEAKITSIEEKIMSLLTGGIKLTDSDVTLESLIKGIATGGSPTMLIDDSMNFGTDLLNGNIINFIIDGVNYYRKITGSILNTLGFSALKESVAATAVVGSGEGAEGQAIVECLGDLVGAVGNDYSIQIVHGTETTGDNIATLDAENKLLLITVHLSGLGEQRVIGAGDLETLLENTVGIADNFKVQEGFTPGNLPIGGDPIPFILGEDGISVVEGTPYEIYHNTRTAAGDSLGQVSIINAIPAGTNLIGKTVPVDADGDEKFTQANPGAMQLTGSRVSTIYGAFSVGTSAVTKAINGKTCTVHVLSGTAWINPLAVAVADATAIKVTGAIDLSVAGNLSLISDATGASVQVIVWE